MASVERRLAELEDKVAQLMNKVAQLDADMPRIDIPLFESLRVSDKPYGLVIPALVTTGTCETKGNG